MAPDFYLRLGLMPLTEAHREPQKERPLLSDKDGKVSKAYDVYKLKNMYGKTYWGIERSTFVIDASGKIKAVFRKVKVDGHTGDVKAALQAE